MNVRTHAYRYPVVVFVCVCVLLFQMCGFCIPSVRGFVYHMLEVIAVFACLRVFLAAAASPPVCCVPLDKAIQASPRTPPQSLGPYKKKGLTAVQQPRALLTNICSRCELLACDTTLFRKGRRWHTHTPACTHVMPSRG